MRATCPAIAPAANVNKNTNILRVIFVSLLVREYSRSDASSGAEAPIRKPVTFL
jgi:hypothetical protein